MSPFSWTVCCALAASMAGQVKLTAPVLVAVDGRPVVGSADNQPNAGDQASGAAAISEVAIATQSKSLDGRLSPIGKEQGAIEPRDDGLKISVKGGHEKPAAAGVLWPLRMRGDFELIVAYEELAISNTTPGRGAGISVAVVVPQGPGETTRGVLHRVFSNQSRQRHYLSERIVEKSGSMQRAEHSTTAGVSSAKQARLRLARTGSELVFAISEVDETDFRELHRIEFPPGDTSGVEIIAHNGMGGASVRARIVELRARAAGLGGAGPTVTTIDNESIAGSPSTIRDGAIVIEGDPPRTIPLDELLAVDFDRPAAPASEAPVNAAAANAKAAGDAANASPGDQTADVLFLSGDQMRGRLIELSADSLRLATSWGEEVDIPLLRLRGIAFLRQAPPAGEAKDAAKDAPAKSESSAESQTDDDAQSIAARWESMLAQPGDADAVLARARDGAATAISGAVQAIRDGKLTVEYEGESRNLDQARLLGVVFAANPAASSETGPFQRFHLLDGQRVAGRWTAIEGDAFALQTPWDAVWNIPALSVREVTSHNGRMVELADLEPVSVEQVPYFGRIRPYQKDRAFGGGPLKAGAETYQRGFAVHSKTTLSFAIDGGFERFRTAVGFDPSAGGKGRVACRVLGDGRELFANADLRADQPPLPLDLPVAGVATLVLEVDFGEAEDAGDDVVWGNPRLYRRGRDVEGEGS